MKKIIAVVLALVMCFSIIPGAYASNENVGLTENPSYLEGTISLNGASAPNLTTVWNISTKGMYTFAGTADSWSTTGLYTNYNFKGEDAYLIQVTNNTNVNITMTMRGLLKTYRTIVIPSNETWLVTLNSTYGISSSTLWYIHFSAPCDVEGYVTVYPGT